MIKHIRQLRVDQWFWLHAKVALLIWGLLYLVTPTPTSNASVGPLLAHSVAIFIIIGSATSIIGLVTSTSTRPDRRHNGLLIELFGLIIAQAGPMTYVIISASAIPDDPANWSRAAFSWAFTALLVARTMLVYRALKFWSVNDGRN